MRVACRETAQRAQPCALCGRFCTLRREDAGENGDGDRDGELKPDDGGVGKDVDIIVMLGREDVERTRDEDRDEGFG
jgi:hypothetical protein